MPSQIEALGFVVSAVVDQIGRQSLCSGRICHIGRGDRGVEPVAGIAPSPTLQVGRGEVGRVEGPGPTGGDGHGPNRLGGLAVAHLHVQGRGDLGDGDGAVRIGVGDGDRVMHLLRPAGPGVARHGPRGDRRSGGFRHGPVLVLLGLAVGMPGFDNRRLAGRLGVLPVAVGVGVRRAILGQMAFDDVVEPVVAGIPAVLHAQIGGRELGAVLLRERRGLLAVRVLERLHRAVRGLAGRVLVVERLLDGERLALAAVVAVGLVPWVGAGQVDIIADGGVGTIQVPERARVGQVGPRAAHLDLGRGPAGHERAVEALVAVGVAGMLVHVLIHMDVAASTGHLHVEPIPAKLPALALAEQVGRVEPIGMEILGVSVRQAVGQAPFLALRHRLAVGGVVGLDRAVRVDAVRGRVVVEGHGHVQPLVVRPVAVP